MQKVIVEHNFCRICANDLSCSYEEESQKGVYKKDGSWKITEWYTYACFFPCNGWISVEEVLKIHNIIFKNYSNNLILRRLWNRFILLLKPTFRDIHPIT